MTHGSDIMLKRGIIKKNSKFINQICNSTEFNVCLLKPDIIKKLTVYVMDLDIGVNISIIDSNYDYYNGINHKKISHISLSYIKGYIGYSVQLLIYLLLTYLSIYISYIFNTIWIYLISMVILYFIYYDIIYGLEFMYIHKFNKYYNF